MGMRSMYYLKADVYRRGKLVMEQLDAAENTGTGVGVFRKDMTPDVERQTKHYFDGAPALMLGDVMVADGVLFRLGSPYNVRGHHLEVTSERIGEMEDAVLTRRVRNEFSTPTEEIDGRWELKGFVSSKRHREETVGGTGKAVKPVKTFTALSLPDGLDEPKDDDILVVRGKEYTVTMANDAAMNADVGLWTASLAEGAI